MSREEFTFRLSQSAVACDKASQAPNKWYTGDQAIGIHQPGTGENCCNRGFNGKPVFFDYSGDDTRFLCPASEAPKSGRQSAKQNRSGYAVGRTW